MELQLEKNIFKCGILFRKKILSIFRFFEVVKHYISFKVTKSNVSFNSFLSKLVRHKLETTESVHLCRRLLQFITGYSFDQFS